MHAFREYEGEAKWDIARWEHHYGRLTPAHKVRPPGRAGRRAGNPAPDAQRRSPSSGSPLPSRGRAFLPPPLTRTPPPQEMLPHFPAKFQALRRAAAQNQAFFHELLQAFDPSFTARVPGHLQQGAAKAAEYARAGVRCSPQDAEKVRYVLKDLVRNWGAEGAPERAQSFAWLLAELRERLPPPAADAPAGGRPRVLVPGAGLGRLCLEVAGLGYEVQGNEWSYYMLLTSSFLLNHAERVGQWAIHPWIHSPNNNVADADQRREVRIPDVLPQGLVRFPGQLSMCAGDFVEVYGRADQRGRWDCVVTCFFLDTAHNVLAYLEVLRHCLRDGGVWINLGPLLFHWADSHTYLDSDELSIEMCLEDVLAAAQRLGFAFARRPELVGARYTSNAESMMATEFWCASFSMVLEGQGGGRGAGEGDGEGDGDGRR